MNKTSAAGREQTAILIDTPTLQVLLGCGRSTAVKLGNDAGAAVRSGRRLLWNRRKIERYIDSISGEAV